MKLLDYDKQKTNGKIEFRRLPKCYSGHYQMPDNITIIGKEAFEGCTFLTSIGISKEVKSINDSAFSGCSKLTAVDIPAKVKSLGKRAFYNCRQLKSLKIHNDSFTAGAECIEGCTILCKEDTDNILKHSKTISPKNPPIQPMPDESWKDMPIPVIPDGVNEIGDNAFFQKETLISISITPSITRIGKYAFQKCKKLNNIIFQKSGVKKIDKFAFKGCEELTNIDLPSGLISIAEHAFGDCTKLERIVIPWGVNSIGAKAFSNCKNLSSIIIPSSVKTIGRGAFSECSKLTTVKIYGENISITWPVFTDCNQLKTIEIIDESKKYIIEDGIVYNNIKTELLECINSILKSDTKSNMKIDDKVKIIHSKAFSNTTGIKTICMPKNLKKIEPEAFDFKSEKVKIFIYNEDIEDIDITATEKENTRYKGSFINCNECTLVVPDCSKYAYSHHPFWQSFGFHEIITNSDDTTATEHQTKS